MRKLISLKFLQVIGSAPSKPTLQFKNCMGKHVEYKIAGKNGQGVLMYQSTDLTRSRAEIELFLILTKGFLVHSMFTNIFSLLSYVNRQDF